GRGRRRGRLARRRGRRRGDRLFAARRRFRGRLLVCPGPGDQDREVLLVQLGQPGKLFGAAFLEFAHLLFARVKFDRRRSLAEEVVRVIAQGLQLVPEPREHLLARGHILAAGVEQLAQQPEQAVVVRQPDQELLDDLDRVGRQLRLFRPGDVSRFVLAAVADEANGGGRIAALEERFHVATERAGAPERLRPLPRT